MSKRDKNVTPINFRGTKLDPTEIDEVKSFEKEIAKIQGAFGKLRATYLIGERMHMTELSKLQELYENRVSQIAVKHGLPAQGWNLRTDTFTIAPK